MNGNIQAAEARAEAYALTVKPREHMGWWAIKQAYLKGAEDERAAMDAKQNHEVYLSDKRAQERDRAEAERDAMAEKVRVLREALSWYADTDNWDTDHPTPTAWDDGSVDAGKRAREALLAPGEAAKKCPPHNWDRSGERCLRCGDKDWMT